MSYSSERIVQVTQLGMVNMYLVREDDGLTLVDGGMPGATKKVLAAAEAMGAPIVRMLLTHAHPDHVGSIDKLAAALPGVPLLMSERESQALREQLTLRPGEPTDGKLPKTPVKVKVEPSVLLQPGDMVGSLEVHAAPGHSVGQVAFLDPRDGTLICGDAYSTLGGVATTAKPNWRFPLPALASWHRPTALRSAQALRALNPSRLAPGHGKVVENPGAAMDRAIGRAS